MTRTLDNVVKAILLLLNHTDKTIEIAPNLRRYMRALEEMRTVFYLNHNITCL